jgi:outer membrane receptor for ferrienterochelin and colicin
MKRLFSQVGLFCIATMMVFSANAQSASTVAGTVKNSSTSETVSAVTISVKGGNAVTFTDDRGAFKLNLTQKLPVTLLFSSVGYETKEVIVNSATNNLSVVLKAGYVLGSDVVVAASRVAERILESPVTIERVNAAQIRASAASSYYDLLTNLKGVDAVSASLTFKTITTRGFSGSGNTRLNQLIDGMDNQAPGLNFSVGTMVGLTELDVDNMELLPGASSALYGSGGMNGTILINSKNPFKYQGLSFQIKQGVNHVDNYQRPQAAYKDYSVRWASKIGDRWAYKVGAQYVEAQDWLAMNTTNYSRTTGTQNGQTITGYRSSDPNYDGVNVYGDETTSSLSSVYGSVKSGVLAALTAQYAGNAAAANAAFASLYGAAQAGPYAGNLANYTAFLKSASASLAPYAPYLYGDAKGMFTGINVSRTGYNEVDIIDPVAKNLKVSGSIHYKVNDKTEASFSAYTGSGNTVYTGSDRYSLNGLNMTQLKFEVKSKNWFARAYQTLEDAGNSYNATITTRLFNEAWKSSNTWYPTYTAAYVQYKDALDPNNPGYSPAAGAAARAVADAGRPTGNIGSTELFKVIAGIPISQGGGKFLDKSSLNVIEAQYNLTDLLGLEKYNASLLVGGSIKGYVLNSQGTLFADTTRRIWINENGTYAQFSKRYFGDILKLSVSGRYDKNDNFAGRFTPRFSAVVKIAEDNNLRVSYQEAYRFPTTQNQWINLLVGGGTRLMGGLPQLRNYYNFSTNPAYSLSSVLAGAPVQQQFGEFKPESMNSFEIGYKTLINKKLLVDFYVYAGKYTNFLSGVTVLQSRNAANPQLADLFDASKRIAYSISTNAPGDVYTSGWGLSADYLLPNNFSFSSSVYTDEIGNLPSGFISYFNTPLFRANFALNNSGFLFKNRLGFSANLHYQDDFVYEGTFAIGKVASFNTIDAVLTYKVPTIKSLIKVGGTNILNHYYQTAFGSPSIGGLYYVSFAYNIF